MADPSSLCYCIRFDPSVRTLNRTQLLPIKISLLIHFTLILQLILSVSLRDFEGIVILLEKGFVLISKLLIVVLLADFGFRGVDASLG